MTVRSTRRAALIAATCVALASCVTPAPEPPPPAPAPSPAPEPAPPPAAAPTYDNWADAPQTPGNWYFRNRPGGSQAVFGPANSEAIFTLTCNLPERTVTMTRAGRASGETAMRIRTETRDRTVAARQVSTELPMIAGTLPATDPLFEAMAFSKGRFAVETQGLATLYIPSWPEVTRVIEDCR
ncbi:hypothetical protein [Pelagerythrobacter rhizovicinus]|uniref:Lipoprotein n=1 Tax=Pelagerythrobacter rhizovicinus TaxID=2268576 RepID=A0A4Q2KT81_9SPHN|nr:hypothetical protein [Pelagerythrobacter rhizovicinus]RXZ66531.1 hypothetical protein ETX26_07595 [Pelagerythrobacter rhizovicinus]